MTTEERSNQLAHALSNIPCGLYILTAAWDGRNSGTLVRWVQRCNVEPPMVMLSLLKGQPVEPLIRDSRTFALCQISDDDRFLQRKFASITVHEDPFVCLATHRASNGAPIIERAMSYLECDLVRNVELDADHRIYVGEITGGGVLHNAKPAISFGDGPHAA